MGDPDNLRLPRPPPRAPSPSRSSEEQDGPPLRFPLPPARALSPARRASEDSPAPRPPFRPPSRADDDGNEESPLRLGPRPPFRPHPASGDDGNEESTSSSTASLRLAPRPPLRPASPRSESFDGFEAKKALEMDTRPRKPTTEGPPRQRKATLTATPANGDMYVANFKTNYFVAEAQAAAGLKTNAAVHAYLNKLHIAANVYAQAINGANKHAKAWRNSGDAMGSYMQSLDDLHSVMNQSSANASLFAKTMSQILEKLQANLTQCNQKLQANVDQHKSISKPIAPLFSQRQTVLDRYLEWQVYMFKKDMHKAWDKKMKVDAEVTKLRYLQATLEEHVSSYLTTVRPLLVGLEELEESRLQALQTCLMDLSGLQLVVSPFSSALGQTFADLNRKVAVEKFAASYKPAFPLMEIPEFSEEFETMPKPADLPQGRKSSLSLLSPLRGSLSRSRSPSRTTPTRLEIDTGRGSVDTTYTPPPTPPPKLPSQARPYEEARIVDVISSDFAPPVICEVLWDYHGGQEGDLVLKVGDLVKLLSPLNVDWNAPEPVWCQGRELSTGAMGGFPSNYVTLSKFRY